MFETQAHSFTQQARLAITLAWVAGYTNTVSLLALNTVTSHMSGTASNLGKAVAELDWGLLRFETTLIAAFVLGAAISGGTMEVGRRRGWESIYVLPIALQAALLALCALGIEVVGIGQAGTGWMQAMLMSFAAAAMGLQNATITRISGGVVRTTHVTGVLTDLGTEVVSLWYMVREAASSGRSSGSQTGWGRLSMFVGNVRRHQASLRLALLASIFGSFVVGAALGTVMFDHAARWSMFPPVVFLLWTIYQDVHRPIAAISTADVVATGGVDLPEWVGVYQVRRDAKRKGEPRMPDLAEWTDRLPQNVRVAILDIEALPRLDDDALTEMASAIERLRGQRRHLIVSGVRAEAYARLREIGAADAIGPECIVPDLEFALMRALAIGDPAASLRLAP